MKNITEVLGDMYKNMVEFSENNLINVAVEGQVMTDISTEDKKKKI